MKHLFQRTIIYQCDLGNQTLVEFLVGWKLKHSYLSWNSFQALFADGYAQRKRYSENHILIFQKNDRHHANIEIQYIPLQYQIKIIITPTTRSYFLSLIPFFITIFAFIKDLDNNIYWWAFAFFVFFILIIRWTVVGTINEIKKDLELELRYHKIPYQVINGEPIYLPS